MKKSTQLIIGISLAFTLFIAYAKAQTATIDLAVKNQYIRGFGGMNLPAWRPDLTTAEAHKAFGVGDGKIGLSVLRVRVPSDATQFYKEYPTASVARSNGVTVFATPWSPPASMKSNGSIVKGTLNTSSYGAYAAHLKSFSNYMASNGAPLYAISLQNEPDWLPDYESCGWTSTQFINFLTGYGSAVGNNIIVAESLNLNHTLTDPILNDATACSKISVIGGHLYGSGLASYPLAAVKGKELWMTEHITDTDSANLWSGAMILGKEIHDCMVAGFNVYTWWYIKRFYGPMDENGNITKRGYVMSQYARFVRPGYTRVNTTVNSAPNIDITAYKKGTNIVIVALNRNATSSNLEFTLQNGSVSNFTRYTTSASKNISKDSTFTILGNSFSTTLDALSVTTFTYRDSLNMQPDANAGSDRTVTDADNNGSESVSLNGSGSTDADGAIVSYVWKENGNQIATGVNPSVNLSVGGHNIALVVTDDSSAIATDTMTYTVNERPNTPPTANAGADQTVIDTGNNGSESVALDGSGSTDTYGSVVSYVWRESGIEIANGVNPSVNLSVGTHNILLIVTDNKGATASDFVTVTISKPTEIGQLENPLVSEFIFYPNPFNSSTAIDFTLEKTEFVHLVVTDISGREVQTLVKDILQAGKHKIIFDGSNLKSGIYFCRFIAGEKHQTIKMTINR